MADKTDDGAQAPKQSDADRVRDAISAAGGVDDGDQDEEEHADDKGGNGAPEGDDHSNGDDGNGSGDDDQDDGADDGSGDDAGDDDEEKGASDVKLSQFKGDGKRGSYTKNLEQGYIDKLAELDKVTDRADIAERQVAAIKEAARKDPEFGQKLVALLDVDGSGGSGAGSDASNGNGGSGSDDEDPFLTDAKTEWKAKNDKSTKEFVDANPEVLTDPKLNKQVKQLMRHFSNMELSENKRLMMGGEAMAKAYAYLGLTDKRKADQDLRDGMKGGAAPTRPQRPTKKPGKSSTKQFSDLTLDFASKMGISKERLVKGTSKK